MKNVICLLTTLLVLNACSSGSGDSKASGKGTPPSVADVGSDSEFDKVAKGTWTTKDCYLWQENQTARRVIVIAGNGKAETLMSVYASNDCSGTPTRSASTAFTFTVDRYANGGGQITVNGEPSDLSFESDSMIWSSAQASVTYLKSN